MSCKECGYYYQDECENFPRCHYEGMGDFDPAPCEQDD